MSKKIKTTKDGIKAAFIIWEIRCRKNSKEFYTRKQLERMTPGEAGIVNANYFFGLLEEVENMKLYR